MVYNKLYLKKGKEESLKRFHPWIFSGAVARIENENQVMDGDLVQVYTSDSRFVAIGHFRRATIMVRVLSFEEQTIDLDFWKKKLRTAYLTRKSIGVIADDYNNIFRLVHGEGDFLPGVIIDCYGNTAVMQAHCIGMHRQRHLIAQALSVVMGEKIKNIYYKSENTLNLKEEDDEKGGYLLGGQDITGAVENGLKFNVDWIKGQKTGFFIDQRENRSLLEKYAKGKTLLNMFCYTGGFSVYAMRGGASIVHSVDSSEKAISLTDQNIALNFPDDTRHKSFCEDAFKYLDHNKDKYDLIILDPPAFAKHKNALHNALKGYTRLNLRGLEQIKPGGILFTFSCSQVVTKDQFRNAVFTAAAQAKRNVKILHQLHQPADHPISIYHPEGEYLKGLVLYIE